MKEGPLVGVSDSLCRRAINDPLDNLWVVLEVIDRLCHGPGQHANTDPGTDTAIKQLTLNEPTANSKGLRFGNFVQIRDVINEELESVWAGDKTAQEALDTAVERGDALLRKFEAAND